MTAPPELAQALTAAGFRAPDYGGQCLDSVLLAAAGALGVDAGSLGPAVSSGPEGTDGPVDRLDPHEAQDRLGVPGASRVCVVLVDGLGYQMLVERAGHAPFLRSVAAGTRVLTAGFPSTTATSIGLFGTGRGSGRTGMAGYTVRNPETGGLANLVSWDGATAPDRWQREPTLLAGLVRAGVPVTSVGPAAFAGSGLTRAALTGGGYVAAEALRDRVDAALFELSAPGLVYLYWGEVDKTGHQHGWRSRAWADALTELDRELGRLARSVPRGTVLLVTADHGMVDVDHAQLVDVARVPELAADVALVAGEPRAAHVHLRDADGAARSGAAVDAGAAEAARTRWRGVLGDAAVVALRDEAIAAGWFGPVSDHVLPMLGDLVVAATGRAGVVDSRTQTPHSLQLRGMHGSLTPGELLVPLAILA